MQEKLKILESLKAKREALEMEITKAHTTPVKSLTETKKQLQEISESVAFQVDEKEELPDTLNISRDKSQTNLDFRGDLDLKLNHNNYAVECIWNSHNIMVCVRNGFDIENNGHILIKDVNSNQDSMIFNCNQQPTSISMTPNSGSCFVVGDSSGLVHLMDMRIPKGKVYESSHTMKSQVSLINGLSFINDYRFMSMSPDGDLNLWEIRNNSLKNCEQIDLNEKFDNIGCPTSISGIKGGTIRIGCDNGDIVSFVGYDLSQMVKSQHYSSSITCIDTKEDGDNYVVSTLGGIVEVYHKTQKLKSYIDLKEAYVCCRWIPQTKSQFATFSSKNFISLIDLSLNSPILSSHKLKSPPICARFSDDGRLLLYGSLDSQIHLIETPLL